MTFIKRAKIKSAELITTNVANEEKFAQRLAVDVARNALSRLFDRDVMLSYSINNYNSPVSPEDNELWLIELCFCDIPTETKYAEVEAKDVCLVVKEHLVEKELISDSIDVISVSSLPNGVLVAQCENQS